MTYGKKIRPAQLEDLDGILKIYDAAKKAFATINSNTASEAEIKQALEFIENATFFVYLPH